MTANMPTTTMSAAADVIERFDGYIAQHFGDGLMVYFGWPQAHEDDAQRAVHAGLGILLRPWVDSMTAWSREKAFAWQYASAFIRVWWSWARSAKALLQELEE
jgi:hypothetical protein